MLPTSKRRPFAIALVLAAGVAAAIVVFAASTSGSPVSRLVSCIEKAGWRRQREPFKINDVDRMHLAFDWAGGPGAYVDVVSLTPGKPFELVAVSEKLDEADQARLLREVQADPGRFEAVLLADHPSPPPGAATVARCSFGVYPNQGP